MKVNFPSEEQYVLCRFSQLVARFLVSPCVHFPAEQRESPWPCSLCLQACCKGDVNTQLASQYITLSFCFRWSHSSPAAQLEHRLGPALQLGFGVDQLPDAVAFCGANKKNKCFNLNQRFKYDPIGQFYSTLLCVVFKTTACRVPNDFLFTSFDPYTGTNACYVKVPCVVEMLLRCVSHSAFFFNWMRKVRK